MAQYRLQSLFHSRDTFCLFELVKSFKIIVRRHRHNWKESARTRSQERKIISSLIFVTRCYLLLSFSICSRFLCNISKNLFSLLSFSRPFLLHPQSAFVDQQTDRCLTSIKACQIIPFSRHRCFRPTDSNTFPRLQSIVLVQIQFQIHFFFPPFFFFETIKLDYRIHTSTCCWHIHE